MVINRLLTLIITFGAFVKVCLTRSRCVDKVKGIGCLVHFKLDMIRPCHGIVEPDTKLICNI